MSGAAIAICKIRAFWRSLCVNIYLYSTPLLIRVDNGIDSKHTNRVQRLYELVGSLLKKSTKNCLFLEFFFFKFSYHGHCQVTLIYRNHIGESRSSLIVSIIFKMKMYEIDHTEIKSTIINLSHRSFLAYFKQRHKRRPDKLRQISFLISWEHITKALNNCLVSSYCTIST